MDQGFVCPKFVENCAVKCFLVLNAI